jgi:hypothetical protein
MDESANQARRHAPTAWMRTGFFFWGGGGSSLHQHQVVAMDQLFLVQIAEDAGDLA